MLQQPLNEELDRLQKQQINVPLECRQNIRMVQQLCPSTESVEKSAAMPGSIKAQQSTNQASVKGDDPQ